MKKKKLDQIKFTFSTKEQKVCRFIEKLIFEKPSLFDQTLLREFKLLSAIKDELFFEYRSVRHLVKLVCTLGYIKWKLVGSSELFCEHKQNFIRLLPSMISYPFGSQSVLGIVIGFTRSSQNERLEQRHILKAFQRIVEDIEYIRGSFYRNDSNNDQQVLNYIEFRKRDGKKFNKKELFIIKRELPSYINDHIETLVPSVFTVRNEEEIGKTLFILNREFCSNNDIPQISIFFEGQSSSRLTFTITCIYSHEKISNDQICRDQSQFPYISSRIEKSMIAGYLENNVEKKALVLTLFYEINPRILRNDFSINLPIVREAVVAYLEQIFGEFRDYNGGLYSKQNNLLKELKTMFSNTETEDFLEKIFYNIFPIENQAVMCIDDLVFLVDLLRNTKKQNLEEKVDVLFQFASTNSNLAIAFKSYQEDLYEHIICSLIENEGTSNIVFTKFKVKEYFCMGVIINASCCHRIEALKFRIESCIQEWRNSFQKKQTLNLSIANTPISLDPRRGGEEVSSTILRFLFEGLMKIGSNGRIEKGIAANYSISKDQKRYVFSLKKTFWSNGVLLTAHDFVYSWMKILSPNFFTPFCYHFYPIKNAKLVKEGKVSDDVVGIKALDEKTLQIDLEKPITYFLELLTHNLYSPIPQNQDSKCPNWENHEQSLFVCNGPFTVEHQTKDFFVFTKNNYYLNSESIYFDKIFISKYTNSQALKAFSKGEIDWLGAPLHPWDVTFQIKHQKSNLKDAGSSEVLWIVNNVSNPYLKNAKLRRSLAYSIDRKEILKKLGHQGFVANSILPRIYSRVTDHQLDEGNIILAKELYEEAQNNLEERLPKFTLYTSHGGLREKIAIEVRDQWEEKLGFICEVQRMEWRDLFKLMVTGDFQLATTMWKPLFSDPMYTLNVFESKSHPVNFSNWECNEFKQILANEDKSKFFRIKAEKSREIA